MNGSIKYKYIASYHTFTVVGVCADKSSTLDFGHLVTTRSKNYQKTI